MQSGETDCMYKSPKLYQGLQLMAGKQHETQPDQESSRKTQISDATGSKENVSNELYNNIFRNPRKNVSDTSNIEEAVKTGVHFYTLSIMNESNKV